MLIRCLMGFFALLKVWPISYSCSVPCILFLHSQEKQSYYILLILTDGTINDLDATKAALVASSHQPMSVIIIGIGNADFSEMDALDSDKQMLSSFGQTAVRDIVQFVS